MPNYRLSDPAIIDIRGIFVFGAEQFGRVQAERYLATMRETFSRLGQNPNIGRLIATGGGLRQHSFGTHVIFYRPKSDGIVVLRVLHAALIRKPILETDLEP